MKNYYVAAKCDACGWKTRLSLKDTAKAIVDHVVNSDYWLCKQTEFRLRSGNIYASRYITPFDTRISSSELSATPLAYMEHLRVRTAA